MSFVEHVYDQYTRLFISEEKISEFLSLLYSNNISINFSWIQFNGVLKTEDDLAVTIINSYVGPILCVFGICGNLLNLIILLKGNLNDSPYLYLKALAFMDLLVLCLSLVHTTYSETAASYGSQLFNAYIFFPLANLCMAASVWLTVGVTIDRLIYVKSPIWARGYCSIQRARTRIICILLLTLIISIPRFFCYKVQGVGTLFVMEPTSFRENYLHYQIYDISCIVLFHLCPLLILILCNLYLIYAVHRARKTRRDLNIRNNRERQWQSDQFRFTITLISIVLVSIIAILPSTIGDFAQFLPISRHGYRKLRLSSNCLLLCNLSMNFLLYCAFNKRFVNVMRSLFCGKNISPRSHVVFKRDTNSTRFSFAYASATL